MAKRRGTSWRVGTESVQGEGSWIELRGLTVGEVKAGRAGELSDDELIREHVTGWNWVDGEGKPLPSPADDPDVVDRLMSDEARAIVFKLFKGDPEFDPNS